ncbi:DUF2254 domain-containing protein [Aquimarina sp. ERC-38]|uniref:DUF2254 domain-containing protein n=1 Tax=Aquimarina sp. ERC-38 TaxID=2949996 RepID=UPI002246C643|nr:DUF2254 domain-containing protein [Aquimarina sp. ERC-38]UZO81110.1 DUF2254 domain-containing protein [Aquimarina sp. ERC-38]
MIKLYKYLEKYTKHVIKSIAFFPVLISLSFLIISFLLFYLEDITFIKEIKEEAPYLFIQNIDTARTALSIIIGGILSLTVFSFSMVMVVLGQASANFSPRLLPGLISDKKHQVILGFYIGTLLFSITTLLFIGADTAEKFNHGISVTLSTVLCFICVGLFAYFIHTISRNIQIDSITESIYKKSLFNFKKKLSEEHNYLATSANVNTKNWIPITSDKTSYFRGFSTGFLSKEIKDKATSIEVQPYIGQHVWTGNVILKVKDPLSEKERELLKAGLLYSDDRLEGDNVLSGLIKLSEVAVKALSPGINDPGTAIDAIAKITRILEHSLAIALQKIYKVKNGNLIVIQNHIATDEIMRLVIQPIRHYGKEDVLVTHTLVASLFSITRNANIRKEEKQSIRIELQNIKDSIKKHVESKSDQDRILSLFEDSKN